MLLMQTCLSFLVVVINLTFMVLALKTSPLDAQSKGTLFIGDCSTAKTANTMIHVVLNLLSSLLLGASNYCMQILVAPSREEVDRAHAAGRALEIGVPSISNILRIDWRRGALWVLMGIVAIVLHLL